MTQTELERGRSLGINAKSRWQPSLSRESSSLLPPILPQDLTPEQIHAYLLIMQIDSLGRRLKNGDIYPTDDNTRPRSPSPPPIYGPDGKRQNTREFRYRKKLEEQRHALITLASKTIPDYKTPSDYKKPSKLQDKVYIPVQDFPHINFIGLLIGPRGNTLKKMEADSGAKISIRGKGSVKEGKLTTQEGNDEPLHCIISADTEEKVLRAIDAINKVIETAASVPEGQNELKRNQLRELAALNGTLRDDENKACANCGAIGHKKYDCPEAPNYTLSIICRNCGGAGHMARDCKEPRMDRGHGGRFGGGGGHNPNMIPVGGRPRTNDDEYNRFMNEIEGSRSAGGPDGDMNGPPSANGAGIHPDRLQSQGSSAGGGAPPPWARSQQQQPPQSQAPPPWARPQPQQHYGYQPVQPQAPAPWQQPQAAPWQQPAPMQSTPTDGAAAPTSYDDYYNYYAYYYQYYQQQAPGAGAGVPGTGAPGQEAPPPPPPPTSDIPPPPPPV